MHHPINLNIKPIKLVPLHILFTDEDRKAQGSFYYLKVSPVIELGLALGHPDSRVNSYPNH